MEYRHWIERNTPFANVDEELATVARQRDHFRRILEPEESDAVYGLSGFLHAFDIRTAYPFLLALLEANADEDEWGAISRDLESFLVRRAFCRLSTKNYNRIFLSPAKNLQSTGFTSANLRQQLLQQSGESVRWPSDKEFLESWIRTSAYDALRNARLVHVLGRLNESFISSKNEPIQFDTQPTVEHIMPQSWQQNWPLADGSKGLDWIAQANADETDPVAIQSREREMLVDTIGNLTLLSHALNAAQSNLGWAEKRPELMRHSLLPINQDLASASHWDNEEIEARGRNLFIRAVQVWPR